MSRYDRRGGGGSSSSNNNKSGRITAPPPEETLEQVCRWRRALVSVQRLGCACRRARARAMRLSSATWPTGRRPAQKLSSLIIRVGDRADTLERNVTELARVLADDVATLGGHIQATILTWCVRCGAPPAARRAGATCAAP